MAVLAKLISKSGKMLRSVSNKRMLERTASSLSSRSFSSSSWESSESDAEEECSSPLPADVPKGFFAVYVGSSERRRRFVVGTHLLSNPVFQVLLERAAEEYGYENAGALTIPCEAVLFEHFLWLLNNNDPAAAMLEVNDLLAFYSS